VIRKMNRKIIAALVLLSPLLAVLGSLAYFHGGKAMVICLLTSIAVCLSAVGFIMVIIGVLGWANNQD